MKVIQFVPMMVSMLLMSCQSESPSSNNVHEISNDDPEIFLPASQLSVKRGLAYGHHSYNDLLALKEGVQWWYNWGVQPETAVRTNYQDTSLEFVPMAWDENFNEAELRAYLAAHPDVKYLLGFNEPNFREQANLTPAQVAQHWPKLEAIAKDFNLKLVGPAVNYSPGQVDIPGTDNDSSPFEFLDAFFEACPNCQVDYIAVHSYMKYFDSVEWFVEEFVNRYNKPVWLTEWASWDDGGPNNVSFQMDYLAQSARWLESHEDVYRYAWFIGRTDGGKSAFPYLDILDGDGELTPLGGLYTSIPATNYRFTVGQRLQAEGGHAGAGYTHKPTTDIDGFVDIVWTENNGYVDYLLNIDSANTVDVIVRAANAEADKTISFLLDNQQLSSLTISNTGGSDQWQTFNGQIELPAGEHTLTLKTQESDYAINWIQLTPH